MEPKRGQKYLFDNDNKPQSGVLVITAVTETHVEYAFVDGAEVSRYTYQMTRELWNLQPDNMRYSGEMQFVNND